LLPVAIAKIIHTYSGTAIFSHTFPEKTPEYLQGQKRWKQHVIIQVKSQRKSVFQIFGLYLNLENLLKNFVTLLITPCTER
jgi:hypothetical protein